MNRYQVLMFAVVVTTLVHGMDDVKKRLTIIDTSGGISIQKRMEELRQELQIVDADPEANHMSKDAARRKIYKELSFLQRIIESNKVKVKLELDMNNLSLMPRDERDQK